MVFILKNVFTILLILLVFIMVVSLVVDRNKIYWIAEYFQEQFKNSFSSTGRNENIPKTELLTATWVELFETTGFLPERFVSIFWNGRWIIIDLENKTAGVVVDQCLTEIPIDPDFFDLFSGKKEKR